MTVLRALLLTDIVESTRMSEQLEEEAATALWSAHDRLARDLVQQWRGREIDKSDGMLVLFDTVSDARGICAGLSRRASRAAAWASRPAPVSTSVALTCVPIRAEDVARGAKPIEVGGLALPTVARVMSVAVGGQTLISDDARERSGCRAAAHAVPWPLAPVRDRTADRVVRDRRWRRAVDGASGRRQGLSRRAPRGSLAAVARVSAQSAC